MSESEPHLERDILIQLSSLPLRLMHSVLRNAEARHRICDSDRIFLVELGLEPIGWFSTDCIEFLKMNLHLLYRHVLAEDSAEAIGSHQRNLQSGLDALMLWQISDTTGEVAHYANALRIFLDTLSDFSFRRWIPSELEKQKMNQEIERLKRILP